MTMFSADELLLLGRALDKKIWSLTHVGMADDDPRKAKYITLKAKVVDALADNLESLTEVPARDE